MLPLAGSPRLTVVGREVRLGTGYADLIAVEPEGRVVIIEVKLAKSAELRRAVVAQVLAYAAFLVGTDPREFEKDILRNHLPLRGFESVVQAAAAGDQEGGLDAESIAEGLADSLQSGRFRLVFVLDDAPEELVQLVGYLEMMTAGLIIDLVTVGTYEVDGSQIFVPQRVEPARPRPEPPRAPKPDGELPEKCHYLEVGEFRNAIELAQPEHHEMLKRLLAWAEQLEAEGLVRLKAYRGKTGMVSLLPRLRADDAGLVTVYVSQPNGYLQFWRSVFVRRAPETLPDIEKLTFIGQGNWVKVSEASEDLLTALTAAYRVAAQGRVTV